MPFCIKLFRVTKYLVFYDKIVPERLATITIEIMYMNGALTFVV